MTKNRRLAYLALTYNAVIWGVAFPIIKPAFDYISSLQYLYFRFLAAGVVGLPIFIYYYLKKHPKPSYTLKLLLIEVPGLVLTLPLLYKGLELTSALDASLIGSTGPIFIVLGGIWFLHERENKREWLGLGLSLFGSLMLVAEPFITGVTSDTPSSALGNIYILIYNLLYTVYCLLAKKFYKTKPQLYFGPLTYLISAFFFALMLLLHHSLPPLTLMFQHWSVLLAVLYMAIPGGILAFALYIYAQSKIEVSEANLFTYLNGAVSIPAAFFILGEKPSILTIISVVVITYGVIIAEKRKR